MTLTGKVYVYSKGEKPRALNLSVNCYWVDVYDDRGGIIFSREPQKANWMDEKHAKITRALEMLEQAIQEAK